MSKNYLTTNKFARVPKSITDNLLNLDKTYGSLSDLVRDLIVFLTKKQGESIFNDIVFTLDEFAAANNVPVAEMQRKLPKEIRDKIVGEAEASYENETGISVLENSFELALWLGTNRNLMMHRVGAEKQFVYEGVQIFKRFEISADFSNKQKRKKRYLVELNPAYKKYMIDNYNIINSFEYGMLPNISAYRNFFLYFSKIIVVTRFRKNKGEEAKFVMSVDELCEVFVAHRSNNYEKKRLVKQTLDGVLKALNVPLFEYSFVKNGNRYAYHVLFDMTNVDLDKYDEGKIAVFFSTIFSLLKNEFINEHFAHFPHMQRHSEFKKRYSEMEDTELKKEYVEWIFKDSANEERKKIFKDTFFKVFNIPYDEIENKYFNREED